MLFYTSYIFLCVFLLMSFFQFLSSYATSNLPFFYGFVLGFCPKCVIVYDGGGYLGTGLCRHSFFWSCCAFSCCLVAHCVAPSAEMLPLFVLGSSCILYVAAFSVFYLGEGVVFKNDHKSPHKMHISQKCKYIEL